MTKTRSMMKGKSLLSEIPRMSKATKRRSITKPSKRAQAPTASNKAGEARKAAQKHIPYAMMVRDTVKLLSSRSRSKVASTQAIARHMESQYGAVNHTHLHRVLQKGVDAGALRKVKQSYKLTTKQSTFGVKPNKRQPPTPKTLAPPKTPTKKRRTGKARATPTPAPIPSTPAVSSVFAGSSTPVLSSAPALSPSPSPFNFQKAMGVSTASGGNVPLMNYSQVLGEEVPSGGAVSSAPSSSRGDAGSGGIELTVDIEKNMLAWNKEAAMTGIASIEAKKGSGQQRPPCDIVAVVDRSGSMAGQKLRLVKEALSYLVSQLNPSDRLSVVSFDHGVYDVFGLRLCTEEGKKTMTSYINHHPKMQCGGATTIRLGLQRGMDFLKQRTFRNPVSAVMLLTDGQGGPPDEPTLKRWESEVGGVPIHCFGFGKDHDARTLANIGDVAHGSFTFVENIDAVGNAFATCLGGVLSVTAQQVVLKLESEVEWARIGQVHTSYPVQISGDGRSAEVRIPDTISEEKKDIVFSVLVGQCPTASHYNGPLFSCCGTYVNVRSDTGRGSTETLGKVMCPLTRPTDDSGASWSMRVDREKNRLGVVEALKEAVRLGEQGNLEGARQCLEVALRNLATSPTGGSMPHLADDLNNAKSRFETQGKYQREGYAFARQQEQSHRRQRAMGTDATYCNPEQIAQRAANVNFRAANP